MDYPGISAESLFLLAENRFQDSKAFYEENKKQIQKNVVHPLKKLIADMTPAMMAVDPLMGGHVSRVRRDNRFTHDKSLYRNNVWISFKPAADRWDLPLLYFEVYPDYFQYGLAFTDMSPAFMRKLRDYISDCPNDFRTAVRKCEGAGLVASGRYYKKPKEGAPKGLEEWFLFKDFYWTKRRTDCEVLQGRDFIPDVLACFEACEHFYQILVEVSDAKPGEYSYEY